MQCCILIVFGGVETVQTAGNSCGPGDQSEKTFAINVLSITYPFLILAFSYALLAHHRHLPLPFIPYSRSHLHPLRCAGSGSFGLSNISIFAGCQ